MTTTELLTRKAAMERAGARSRLREGFSDAALLLLGVPLLLLAAFLDAVFMRGQE